MKNKKVVFASYDSILDSAGKKTDSVRGGTFVNTRVLARAVAGFVFSIALAVACFGGIAAAQGGDMRMLRASYIEPAAVAVESAISMERRVFDLVNTERVSNHRKPLSWNEKAAAAARYHSNNMAAMRFLGHEDMAGQMVRDRAEKFGIGNWRQLGENVSWISGYNDPVTRAVTGWMNSPSHRRNILDGDFREAGLGVALGRDGKFYFTQVFVVNR